MTQQYYNLLAFYAAICQVAARDGQTFTLGQAVTWLEDDEGLPYRVLVNGRNA